MALSRNSESESVGAVTDIRKGRRIFTPLFYFFLWCGCIFCQSMLVSGFLNIVLTTIQVEFQISSAKAGLIPSNYDIAAAVTVLFVAHFGSLNKPRTLGFGVLTMGAGSLIFALTHFIFGTDDIVVGAGGSLKTHLCETALDLNGSESDADCSDSETMGNSGAYILLTLGSVLIGIGASPVYTVGTTFCDEILPPQKVSVYFGVSYAISAIAPAVGFILGGMFLLVYKSLGEPPQGLTVENTNWVGAWWLGFLISALLAFVFGLLLLLFPSQLPESEEVKQKKIELNIQVETIEENKKFVDLLKEMLPLLKGIMLNPVFVLYILGGITDSLLISAFSAWLPKMIESQFGVTSSLAAYLFGGVTVPGAAGGIFIGGLIVKWKKLDGLQCLKWQAYIGLICIVSQFTFLIHCPSIKLDGFNSNFNQTCLEAVNSTCQKSCPGGDVYEPVCLEGVTYTSPCAAACTQYNSSSTDFYNCCGGEAIATSGTCDTNCNLLIPFVICLMIMMFFTFLTNVFSLTVILRCVKDSERVVAISVQSVMCRVFGAFPGPIILGAFIDKACILWNTSSCGDHKGACQEYNNSELMTAAVSMAMIAKIIGTIFYFLGWRIWIRRGGVSTDEGRYEIVSTVNIPAED